MTRIHKLLLAFAIFPLASGLVRPMHGQAVANAEVHGVVQDSSGAVVPNAQVKATQTETGRGQSTVSGADGNFSLPNLPVGPYKLDVSGTGFKGYTQSGIILQ